MIETTGNAAASAVIDFQRGADRSRSRREEHMKYRHVIFDLDGTVVDNEYVILQSLQDMLLEVTGVTHAHDELKFSLGVPAYVPLEHFTIADKEAALAIWGRHQIKYSHLAKPFPEVVRVMEELRSDGAALGVVTSRTRNEYIEEFLPYGLGDMFGVSICADDTERHKPEADPLLEYLRRTGCPREDAIYVGDSQYDMLCAKAAGVDRGHALWGTGCPPHPDATYHFRTPAELLTCVSGTGK